MSAKTPLQIQEKRKHLEKMFEKQSKCQDCCKNCYFKSICAEMDITPCVDIDILIDIWSRVERLRT